MNNKYPRLLTALCALILTIGSLWAVPAYRGWQERTLADGTTITLRQIGDEFYHYWETQDGKIALEQEDGTFVVTDQPRPTGEQIAARRKASNMYQSQPRKAIGERNFAPKGLVILVQFQDVSFKSENNATAFNNMLNQDGYNVGGAIGSAKDYFKAQSNGEYVPQFDVFGPVTLPQNLVYYGEQKTVNGEKINDMYIADFVIDAVKAADDAGCNFANYDSDGDGKVDIVYLFYAGKGQAAGGTSETIWPHNWELLSALYYERIHSTSTYYCNVNSYGYITSYNLPKHDGKTINNYVCSAELKSSGNRSGIGTLCHEFSHVLGLPDYYDTEYGDNDDNGVTPGTWSLMDQGSYNGDEMTPPNYSIYDKYFMGWATPKFLAVSEKVNVTMTTGYSDAYQITGGSSLLGYNNTSTIYYIENRQKTGWDAGIPGSGLLVWQVKYNSDAWSDNEPNNTAGNPRCTIVPADGKTSNYGAASDVFPTGSYKSYKPFNGCELSEITKSGSNITFKYNGGVSATEWSYTLYGDHCTYPADGTVLKNAALELTITPDAGYTLADAACWDVTMDGSALTYGTDFTYNSSTNKFRIESVTGDVEILVEGLRPVTWMTSGSTYATNVAAGGKITLPDDPDDCSATKKFVGWCTISNYSNATTAPTFAKTGDSYSVATYYAVYATPSGSSAPIRKANATVGTTLWGEDFSGFSANDVPNTSYSDSHSGTTVYSGSVTYFVTNGGGTTKVYNENSGGGTAPEILIAQSNGTLSISGIPTGGATEMSLTFVSNKTTFSVTTESTALDISGSGTSWTISVKSGQTSPETFDLTIKNTGSKNARVDNIVLKVTTAGSDSGSGGGSGSYKDYTTVCETCTLTGITLNTSSVTKTFVKDATFNYDNLVVTASYSDCGSKTVTPTSVSTPDMSSTGTKDVTVSYTEGSVTKTAQYQITVSAPYTVTYMVCGEEFTTQTYAPGATLVLPTSIPSDNAGKSFVGWTTAAYTHKTDAPTYVTAGGAVNADVTYYAVFK